MDTSLRIFLFAFIALFFTIIITLVKKAAFGTRYALLWIFSGIMMLLFALFPKIIFAASNIIGISNPVNAIFFLFSMFTIVLLLSMTSIVSGLNDKNLKLIQSVALLEQRVNELEKK